MSRTEHHWVTAALFRLGNLSFQSSAADLQSQRTRSTECASLLKIFAFLAFQMCQQTSAMKEGNSWMGVALQLETVCSCVMSMEIMD
jgi:hypothetical protein